MNLIRLFGRTKQDSNDFERTASPAAAVGQTGIVLKATEGRFYRARVENAGAAACFLMVFSKATAPVNGDVPLYRHRVAPTAGETIDLEVLGGVYCAAGVSIAFSSTPGALTLLAANDVQYTAFWK